MNLFFQAEDGIRYAQESRGLGDVYKRQLLVILSYSISLSAQNNYVTLHEDCNYSGKQSVLALSLIHI